MYRCEKCNTVVPPNHKLNRVVVETREKTYPIYRSARTSRRRKPVAEQVGTATGFEIARELKVCAACARELAEGAAVA